MNQFLLILAWIAALIYATVPAYWLLVHPFVGFWRGRGATLKGVGPLWMLLWIVAGLITHRWLDHFFYRSAWSLLALILLGTGLYIYSGARRQFSTDQVLGRAELEPGKHEQRLVTSGIRARVRHPYYLGHLLNLTALTVASGSLALFALWGFAVATGTLMIVLEERELVARFGDQYRAYQRRVPAVIPAIRNQRSAIGKKRDAADQR